jgi:YfiH family protein
MPFRDIGPVRLFQFDTLQSKAIVHGIVTRRGGASPAPWSSLNVGGTVGDEPDRVRDNRRRLVGAFDLELASVFDTWQIHSDAVVIADAPRGEAPLRQADAILSSTPGVTLMMRFADCVPLMLYDPTRRVIGMVHAGWLGTVRQIARAAIRAMTDRFGTDPGDVLVGIGPSIAVHHYPVGDEVVDALRSSLGPEAERHLQRVDGETRLDLWSANTWLLQQEGVRHIELAGLCTACDTDDWYSHRAEAGRTGRFGAVLALRE